MIDRVTARAFNVQCNAHTVNLRLDAMLAGGGEATFDVPLDVLEAHPFDKSVGVSLLVAAFSYVAQERLLTLSGHVLLRRLGESQADWAEADLVLAPFSTRVRDVVHGTLFARLP